MFFFYKYFIKTAIISIFLRNTKTKNIKNRQLFMKQSFLFSGQNG